VIHYSTFQIIDQNIAIFAELWHYYSRSSPLFLREKCNN
jgi:hypothetical protein